MNGHMVCLGLTLVAVMKVLASTGARAQTAEPVGVALELAMARARNISDLRYELALSIPTGSSGARCNCSVFAASQAAFAARLPRL
jgi:hypothetical protein